MSGATATLRRPAQPPQGQRQRARRARQRTLWSALILSAAATLVPRAAPSKTYETRDDALARVFGSGAAIERRSAFLTDEQIERVRVASASRVEHARVTYYVGVKDGAVLGRAYLDTHVVRSLYETILVVVAHGRTSHVDILAFHEPEDYLPPRRWLSRLEKRGISKNLRPGDAVDAISGATLSARAATAAVRRILAIDAELFGEQP